MGGGGAMRAATKVASFGINAGLRNAQEQSIIRNASRSRSVVVGNFSTNSSTLSSDVAATTATKTSTSISPIDDWDFAEDDDYGMGLLDSMNPKPRLVFGGVPSYDEAKEATNDLKEAVESLSKSGHSEIKSHITSESAVVSSSVAKPIFHAFSLLKESPEAQSVVASLASDKNVWDAVMQNEKVMEFFSMLQNTPSEVDPGSNQPFVDDLKSRECSTEDAENEKVLEYINMKQNCFPYEDHAGMEGVYAENSGNEFMKFIDKVKATVKDMISSLSGFFQNIFGSTENRIPMDGYGASFMALAVLTIMVAVLKRSSN
ncbi:hypothetical protein AQUCO_01200268v1 [Aquilegia coerulea]|uniref:Uncharacterized protein n=1 Tax=Aquilegia coerulea TaxID=218851 RepID=A0A2G5E542_AQUCA|nr:hypothetical protein AQUCO_01200268v1 [Aquilegia coerulea]